MPTSSLGHVGMCWWQFTDRRRTAPRGIADPSELGHTYLTRCRSPDVICHARTRAAREPKPQRTVRRAIRPCPTARPRRCSDQMGLMSGRVYRPAGGEVAPYLADLLQVRGGG